METLKNQAHRWGVILAGGDGTRLLSLTRQLTGDDTPKQFCALTGRDTLLTQTRKRVARNIPDGQVLYLLTEKHRRFFASQLRDVDPWRLLVQPYNHGTAPAIVWSLARLQHLDPNGVVAFFPSDHHFDNDATFAAHVDLAFRDADANADRVVLIGVTPDAPEEAYGWIEPGKSLSDAAFEVTRFWEKPSRRVAAQLMLQGCLWNSFVMVGRIGAFLDLVRGTLPTLLAELQSIAATPDPGAQRLERLYDSLPAANFSDDVLAMRPSALAVLRTRELGWSDLGEPQRVFSLFPMQEMAVA